MEGTNQPTPKTLGQYLEQGRQDAGLTVRQLGATSGISKSTINRLLKDEIESPSAEHVQQLSRILELDETDAFAYMGVTLPNGLPSMAPYLRLMTGLEGDALGEVIKEIERIKDKYDGTPPDK